MFSFAVFLKIAFIIVVLITGVYISISYINFWTRLKDGEDK